MKIPRLLQDRAKKVIERFKRGDAVVKDGGITITRALAISEMLRKGDLDDGELNALDVWIDQAERPYSHAP